jgi:hypothetical protein
MLPVQRFVTADSQRGRISYDGRSEKSSAWAGGAGYVFMCKTCGLEPSKPGRISMCLCMCKTCSRVLDGHGDAGQKCRRCGNHDGDEEAVYPICTREVKAKKVKRPRCETLPSSVSAAVALPIGSPVPVAAGGVASAGAEQALAVAAVAAVAVPSLPFPPVTFCYFA